MNESPGGCKPFECAAHPLLDQLLAGRKPVTEATPVDLREMAKFSELANLHGLAAHQVDRPWPIGAQWSRESLLREFGAPRGEPHLSAEAIRNIVRGLKRQTLFQIAGWIAPGAAPAHVTIIAPQSDAHLLAAFQAMLWPDSAQTALELSSADWTTPQFTLLLHSAPVVDKAGATAIEQFIGYWPRAAADENAGLGLLIGWDDPYAVRAPIDWWFSEQWIPRRYVMTLSLETPGGEQEIHLPPDPHHAHVWRNPLIAASAIRQLPAWRSAALAVDNLLFGLHVDRDGHFPTLELSDSPIPPTGSVVLMRRHCPAAVKS